LLRGPKDLLYLVLPNSFSARKKKKSEAIHCTGEEGLFEGASGKTTHPYAGKKEEEKKKISFSWGG